MFPRREALSLDGAWEFIPDPERTLAPDRLPRGRPITVPGAWEAQLSDPYGIVSPVATAMLENLVQRARPGARPGADS